jgi:putative SbcD/Mre11-related phosphoesterase
MLPKIPFDDSNAVQLFEVKHDVKIIVGTPILYMESMKTIVLGDLHFGQEAILVNNSDSTTSAISKACINLRNLVESVVNQYKIQKIILNGDIKDKTNGVNTQEVNEIKYFFDSPIVKNCECILVRGNHDKLINLVTKGLLPSKSRIVDDYLLNGYFFHHGHLDFDPKDAHTIILSHEHPAYILGGRKQGKAKVRAFVTLQTTTEKNVIILPAASDIAIGVNFPPTSKEYFLSPFLRNWAEISAIQIYPFDKMVGILPIPHVKEWRIY